MQKSESPSIVQSVDDVLRRLHRVGQESTRQGHDAALQRCQGVADRFRSTITEAVHEALSLLPGLEGSIESPALMALERGKLCLRGGKDSVGKKLFGFLAARGLERAASLQEIISLHPQGAQAVSASQKIELADRVLRSCREFIERCNLPFLIKNEELQGEHGGFRRTGAFLSFYQRTSGTFLVRSKPSEPPLDESES